MQGHASRSADEEVRKAAPRGAREREEVVAFGSISSASPI